MKEVFLVTTDKGAKIVSARVLAHDVKSVLAEQKEEYKRCDLESICEDVIKDYTGKSITQEDYNYLIEIIGKSLISYTRITPYQYMNSMLENNKYY